MPLYEYRCNGCGAVFELLRAMSERSLEAVCPACEAATTMPLISRVGALAGSGSRPVAAAPGPSSGGGCCGGACGCR